MNPDDINGCPLEAAYRELQRIPQPNPLKDATPVSWVGASHEGSEL